ncbi:MAG TPA: hypothetical protein VGF85_12740 [Opitutaceae bacterium]|jgi:hypothetical protein
MIKPKPRFKVSLAALLLGAGLFGTGHSLMAQNWKGILSPARAADWSKAGIAGGIPKRTKIFKTFAPGATAEQINAAIAACPAGWVVYLGPGAYELSSGIEFANHSYVTLRGAGADRTFLTFTGSTERWGISADISIANSDGNLPHPEIAHGPGGPSNQADWTGGYAQRTTEITLSSTEHLVAGKSIVCLDQLDDPDADTGGVWVSQKHNVSAVEGPSGTGRPGRAQMQMVLVTGIHGNTVTISPGLYMPNWRADRQPGAWWATTVVTGDGIENLSIDHADSGAKSGIHLFNAYQCWVRGVRDVNSNRNHVWLFLASHCEVRDCYFYGTQNSIYLSYGVELFMACDDLVENNIFQHIVSPMITNGCGSGTVFGYNFATDDYYSASRSWFMPALPLHSAGTDMILYEGNDATGLVGDYIHGTHNLITMFRNQLIGWDVGMLHQTDAIYLYSFSRYFNFIGNVLGKSGYHVNYEDVPPHGIEGNRSIYVLGWGGNGGGTSALKNDPLVASTSMRWGNFDTVSNRVRWEASEVPSEIGSLANAVPKTHTLPASFYRSRRPAWWGSMPWPAIGPEVSGGTDPTGHVYANPAEACYNSCQPDPAYPEDISGKHVLIFNAAKHYGAPEPSR